MMRENTVLGSSQPRFGRNLLDGVVDSLQSFVALHGDGVLLSQAVGRRLNSRGHMPDAGRKVGGVSR